MKNTPIQKAIQFAENIYTPTIGEPIIKYLQSLLAEERQMVEDAYAAGGNNFDLDAGRPKPYPSGYFTKTYES